MKQAPPPLSQSRDASPRRTSNSFVPASTLVDSRVTEALSRIEARIVKIEAMVSGQLPSPTPVPDFKYQNAQVMAQFQEVCNEENQRAGH
jgi:hypothetical protein